MKAKVFILAALVIVGLIGCRKEDNNDGETYPVWILDLYVYGATSDPSHPLPPLSSSPVAVCHVDPGGIDMTVGLLQGTNNRIKIWHHIDSTATVQYYVRCEHYYDSDHRVAIFDASQAVQGPGRPGPEVIRADTLYLNPVGPPR